MLMVVRSGRLATIAAAIALFIPACCRAAPAQKVYTFRHAAMGTQFALYLYANNEAQASGVAEEAFDEVDRIEQELSNYRTTSELSRIAREAALAPVTTDPETFRFLEESQHWSQVSDGAFDITVGSLMKGGASSIMVATSLRRMNSNESGQWWAIAMWSWTPQREAFTFG